MGATVLEPAGKAQFLFLSHNPTGQVPSCHAFVSSKYLESTRRCLGCCCHIYLLLSLVPTLALPYNTTLLVIHLEHEFGFFLIGSHIGDPHDLSPRYRMHLPAARGPPQAALHAPELHHPFSAGPPAGSPRGRCFSRACAVLPARPPVKASCASRSKNGQVITITCDMFWPVGKRALPPRFTHVFLSERVSRTGLHVASPREL